MKLDLLKSKFTHDKSSNRIYLMHLHQDDFPGIIQHFDHLAQEYHYTKIFVKVATHYAPAFFSAGYSMEAFIPKFFYGEKDVVFLSKFLSSERQIPEYEHLQAFQNMLLKSPLGTQKKPDPKYALRKLSLHDIQDMIRVFRKVFETYPFPIFETDFLEKSMQVDGTRYFGAFLDNQLVAVSSAECDEEGKNAEMTDFAVLPECRGLGLAVHLLSCMEHALEKDNFKTFYTISRLKSLPMNKTFYNANYSYAGTLIQNTQISGSIESMNVWYKRVDG